MADLRLRAINAIQRLNKKTVETVKPGTLFNAKDEAQFKELTSGTYPAAVPAPVEETADDEPKKASAKKKAPAKKAAPKAPAKDDEGGEGGSDDEGGEGEDDLV